MLRYFHIRSISDARLGFLWTMSNFLKRRVMAWQSSGYRGAGQYRDIRGTD